MFSVADLLERAMCGGNIDTHYRLAKVIGISQGAMTGYKSGKTMPDARVLEQLCALSGDDLAVVAAQIQAERERTPEAKNVWLMIAKRLAGGAQTAVLSLLAAIVFVAGSTLPTRSNAAPLPPTLQQLCILCLVIFAIGFIAAYARPSSGSAGFSPLFLT